MSQHPNRQSWHPQGQVPGRAMTLGRQWAPMMQLNEGEAENMAASSYPSMPNLAPTPYGPVFFPQAMDPGSPDGQVAFSPQPVMMHPSMMIPMMQQQMMEAMSPRVQSPTNEGGQFHPVYHPVFVGWQPAPPPQGDWPDQPPPDVIADPQQEEPFQQFPPDVVPGTQELPDATYINQVEDQPTYMNDVQPEGPVQGSLPATLPAKDEEPSYMNQADRLRGTSLPPQVSSSNFSPKPPPRSRRGSRRGSLLSLNQIGQGFDPEHLSDKLKKMNFGGSTASLKDMHPTHKDPKTMPSRPPRRKDHLRKAAINREFKNLSVINEDLPQYDVPQAEPKESIKEVVEPVVAQPGNVKHTLKRSTSLDVKPTVPMPGSVDNLEIIGRSKSSHNLSMAFAEPKVPQPTPQVSKLKRLSLHIPNSEPLIEIRPKSVHELPAVLPLSKSPEEQPEYQNTKPPIEELQPEYQNTKSPKATENQDQNDYQNTPQPVEDEKPIDPEQADYQNVGDNVENLPPLYVNSAAVKDEAKDQAKPKLHPVITVTLSEGYTEKPGGNALANVGSEIIEDLHSINTKVKELRSNISKAYEPLYASPKRYSKGQDLEKLKKEEKEESEEEFEPIEVQNDAKIEESTQVPATVEEMTREQINRAFRAAFYGISDDQGEEGNDEEPVEENAESSEDKEKTPNAEEIKAKTEKAAEEKIYDDPSENDADDDSDTETLDVTIELDGNSSTVDNDHDTMDEFFAQNEDERDPKSIEESMKQYNELLSKDIEKTWADVEGAGDGAPPPLILHSQLR